MDMIKRLLTIVACLLLIPATAVLTAAVKQRYADGPNRFFSGGPLIAGDIGGGHIILVASFCHLDITLALLDFDGFGRWR